MTLVRQGDVLIVSCDKIPEKVQRVAPENGRLIVARGEATGYHHSFPHRRGVTLFRDDGAIGGFYVRAKAPIALEHQEHATLTLPAGDYKVMIQRTFSVGLVRRVSD